jgi:hypothetical protein
MWISKKKLQELQDVHDHDLIVKENKIKQLKDHIDQILKPATNFFVHFDVGFHNKTDSESITNVSRIFEYTSLERAMEAVKQLKETYRINMEAQESNLKSGTVEGCFSLNVAVKDIVFTDIWMTYETKN